MVCVTCVAEAIAQRGGGAARGKLVGDCLAINPAHRCSKGLNINNQTLNPKPPPPPSDGWLAAALHWKVNNGGSKEGVGLHCGLRFAVCGSGF